MHCLKFCQNVLSIKSWPLESPDLCLIGLTRSKLEQKVQKKHKKKQTDKVLGGSGHKLLTSY